jgi:hypothetical protein
MQVAHCMHATQLIGGWSHLAAQCEHASPPSSYDAELGMCLYDRTQTCVPLTLRTTFGHGHVPMLWGAFS